MAAVCREFGISRKTGYKIFNRYKDCGLRGLEDRARSPYRHANKLPFQVEKTILRIKQEHGTWGAPKIRDKLIREYPAIRPPATTATRSAHRNASSPSRVAKTMVRDGSRTIDSTSR
jgi:putative transposase